MTQLKLYPAEVIRTLDRRYVEEYDTSGLKLMGKAARSVLAFIESEMPNDAILVHLHARPEVIAKRLADAPHPHTIIQKDHIPMILDGFAEEYRASWIQHKIEIDTSDLSPTDLLAAFFNKANAHFNTRDALLLTGDN